MIHPAAVRLAGKERAQFFSDGARWTWSPKVGSFDEATGTYTAPDWVLNSRSVFLTAHDPANPAAGGTAEIQLTSSPFWLWTIGLYMPALFFVLLAVGWLTWPGIPPAPVLQVNPPAATVGKGQTQQFTASLDDVPEQDVSWTATAGTITPAGFYTPPIVPAPPSGQKGVNPPGDQTGQTEQTVTITATRNSDKTKSASAVVIVSADAGLFLYPALSHVQRGGAVQLIAGGIPDADVEWPQIAPKGVFQVTTSIAQRKVVSVSVIDKKHPAHVAGARILVLPGTGTSAGGGGSDITLIVLAMAAGGLGGWLAAVRSFIGFTGNRTFIPSWSMLYLMRPGFGAGLALVAHMAFRAGSIGPGSSASNPAVVVFYSALVGLFSDEALQKMHDIFCTIFGIQDKRSDKMTDKGAGQSPVITRVSASAASGTITIDGGNFAPTATVLANNAVKPMTFISDKRLEMKLDPGTAVGTELAIQVRNPDGKITDVSKCQVAA